MAAFEARRDELQAESIRVVGLSVDDQAHAREMADEAGVTFPLGYGAPLLPTATTLRAYYEERRQILHATGFVVRPDATISIACYSTGAIGRLDVDDVLRLVRFFKTRG